MEDHEDAAARALRLRVLNHENSPLLRLPRELRDQILQQVLPKLPPKPILGLRRPPLMYSCHQIRQDVAELIYPNKTWICLGGDTGRMTMSFDRAHKGLLKAVRYVFVGWEITSVQRAAVQAGHLDKQCGFKRGTFCVRAEIREHGMQYINALGDAVE